MGLLLFLLIVGGFCVGLYIVDRMDSARIARPVQDRRLDVARPLETS